MTIFVLAKQQSLSLIIQSQFEMTTACYQSPIGLVKIQASQDAITSVILCDVQEDTPEPQMEILKNCIRQLDEYFNGQRTVFDLPVRQDGTDFQQSVWSALVDIPFGKTVSYADIAQTLGNPQSVRAVGAANGKNKIWVIVPCHRVIGSDGSLTGYAGGIECKKWLLEHEAKVAKKLGLIPNTQKPVQLELF